MPTIWQQDNFVSGIHTRPAQVEDGEYYPSDMVNLRPDENGWLGLRPAITDPVLLPTTADVTGVATTSRHIFLLHADGRLTVRFQFVNTHGHEFEVTGVQNMSGRISVIEYTTHVIITSEGADQGYWIALDSLNSFTAQPFGIDPPDNNAFNLQVQDGFAGNILQNPKVYLYKITYVRYTPSADSRFFAPILQVAPGGTLFNTMESNATTAKRVVLNRDLDAERDELNDVFLKAINLQHATDPQVTGINIYRTTDLGSGAASVLPEVRDELDTNLYRHVAYVPRSMTEWDEKGGGEYTPEAVLGNRLEIEWEDCAPYERVNDRMPPEVKQFYFYNDRIFGAAGDRLVYSEIEFGNPHVWAFPPKNDIRRSRPGAIDFCAEYREVLLFGSKDGLFRLTGFDPSDFNPDDIGASGPADPYSWAILENAFAFISQDGLHLTDATDSTFTSNLILDRFFEHNLISRGSILFVSANAVLFSVKGFDDEFTFLWEKGFWTRWEVHAHIEQFARGDTLINSTRNYMADGGTLKHLDWYGAVENDDEDLDWQWESNWISGRRGGIQNISKQFQELLITADGGSEVKLETWTNKETTPRERIFTTRDDDYFQRVPIQRYAERLKFRLSGTGPVRIRGLQIES